MKTTIELSDALFRGVKALAVKRGTTLRALVEEGLRHVLALQEDQSFRLRDAAVDGNGLQPEFRDGGWEDIRKAVYSGRGS